MNCILTEHFGCFECNGEGVLHVSHYGTLACPLCGGSGEARAADHSYDGLMEGWTEREQEDIIEEAHECARAGIECLGALEG